MKVYGTDEIRNVALIGHAGSGKTTLTEALLHAAGVTKRKGSVEDGNTMSDFNEEEISRQVSIGTSIIPIESNNIKYNFLDTPGYFDFAGEMLGALTASEGAILIVDAASGVEVGTEKAWKYTEDFNIPKIIFLNKMEKENVNYEKSFNQLKEFFGDNIVPFTLPIGQVEDFKGIVNVFGEESNIPEELKDEVESIKEMLMEKVAETEEELMEKYFEGEAFTDEELQRGLKNSLKNGDLVPLLVGSGDKDIGMEELLDTVKKYIPAPSEVDEKVNPEEPFSASVFKTIVDPFVGKLTLFKVKSGKIKKDDNIYNSNREDSEKLSGLFVLRGKEQINVSEIVAGDIGATSKLQVTETGDTLCDKDNMITYEGIEFAEPTLFFAMEPKSKGDEEKIGTSLSRLREEDPTFTVERNSETKQLLIGGQGNMQINVIKDKLKNSFGVEVELTTPKVAYREAIKGKSDVQGKHKKQSGGAGQYGDVFIKFEPAEEEFIFEEEIFGGAVPRQYFSAVEKGLEEALERGPLAGYPVVNVKATLYDGSYHPVDSNEMAFKMAATLAFRKGIVKAKPILLEPIMKVEVLVPEEYMGDVMGDMNKRRGRILGMEPQEDGKQLVISEAPQSELFEYAIDLRSMTQARGSFTMEFIKYEEVPAEVREKIIEEAEAEKE
ncbi:MAG TPA: elongation factor G [Tissierellales bacterium]|nr:elongation factor G [Tissierellales bacterium]